MVATAATPDFSGGWRLENSRSDFARETPPVAETIRMQHKDPSLEMTIEQESAQGKSTVTFKYLTTGVETVNDVMGNPMKATARWDGNALVIRTTGSFGGNEIELNDRYTLSNTPGVLILKRHFEGKQRGGVQDQSLLFVAMPSAQHPTANLDETKVGTYQLPDPLVLLNGERVTTADMWTRKRRPEILHLFEENMHGRSPAAPANISFQSTSGPALDGKAIRREVTISFPGHDLPGKPAPALHVLIYLPAAATAPVPLFLGLNFMGNAATELPDGKDASHWPYARLVEHGYGLATMWTGDMAPDKDKTLQSGVYALFYKPGQTHREPDDWGALAAWAWGMSRAMDYFEKDRQIDASRVAVIGHSRNAKAAVWAGASDTRFALVVSNESGEGGAAISRRTFGEMIGDLNTNFPHWYSENYRKYNGNAAASPVDSNLLLSLIAPRPLYVASAQGDLWSDPRGEFLGAQAATPVYQLLGFEGMAAKDFPPVEQPITSRIGYHIRNGKHDITEYDWEQYVRFADKFIVRK
jgi:(4-O-methyl)-D-glucuronate---lignin esterase